MENFKPPTVQFTSKGKEVAVEKGTTLALSPMRRKRVSDGFGSLQFEQESVQMNPQDSNAGQMISLSLESLRESDVLTPWATNAMPSTSKDSLPGDRYMLFKLTFN